tara:strand:- start:198 stop:899 length:702 start_codon:yes stop_codon:yes gene_type:complete
MTFLSSRSGTVGTLGTKSNNNDYLGDIRFCGDNGTNNNSVLTAGQITVRQKSAVSDGATSASGEMSFYTGNPDGAAVSEKMKIDSSGAIEATYETAALLGYYTTVNNTNHYVDFPEWTRDSFTCLEVFGNVNPNSSGGGYSDPVHMYIYKGIGWTGSRVGFYIYCVSVAPPARHAFPSGSSYSGNAQISAVWTDGSSNNGNETATSTNYIRLLIPNANASNNFPKQFRFFKRR